ncbi:hypothetical protein AGR4A_pAt10099 [Agrobacterium tumefaciens str. B6]|uniref:Uncharacterized protein n=1 Tax=Agrobacterium tumefaciens str. B6 TaxID=1183423 RepID=A0A822VC28_AGRTU|nr:hypothetical protein AGR4A_pAt10099 [Agrobacterium tumefaciens str. B6]
MCNGVHSISKCDMPMITIGYRTDAVRLKATHCAKRNTLVRFIAIHGAVKLVQFRAPNISRRSSR